MYQLDRTEYVDLFAFFRCKTSYLFFYGTASMLPGVYLLGFQGSGNPVQRIGVALFSLVPIISYAYIKLLS
jgi:hypothetical protein